MRHLWLCAVCEQQKGKKTAPLADTMVRGTMLCEKHANEALLEGSD